MKKLLLAIALLLIPASASAQCSGIFSANTACGVTTSGVPHQIPFSAIISGGGASRTLLSVDTTFWRRSDGSDTVGVCNGTANAAAAAAPNCAKQTWNVLYPFITATYDFNGHTVTLKSGTADTVSGANVGLTMANSYVGGGALVIDLNGSNIAETATKGIINNAQQSGGINITNSAGLGVGGNISSAGFSCIQNSAPVGIGIGVGISTGPCFDAAYEVIQGGYIALAAPVNSIGSGGHSFVLTATGGSFGFNGQTVNYSTDQTYTVGYATAQWESVIIANSVTFNNVGGHTITGPKYSVNNNSSIYTGGAGITYFPGSTAGALVSDSGGCYDTICYESLADGTPILGSLLVTSIAAPGSPAAGKLSIWADSTNSILKVKDSAGNISVTPLLQSLAPNFFVTGLNATGTLTSAQPSLSNLSGWGTNVLAAAGNALNGASGLVGFNGNIGTTATGHASLDLALTGGTMSGTLDMGSNIIQGLTGLAASAGMTIRSNGLTSGAILTSTQQWGFGTTTGALTPTNTQFVISKNVTAVDAATTGLVPLLHVVGADTTIGSIILDGFGNQTGFGFRRANGTAASKTAVTAGPIGSFFGLGWDTTAYGYGPEIDLVATETWSATAHGSGLKFYSVVNTTTTQVNSMTLFNSGGLSVGSTTDPGTGVINALNGFSSGGTIGVTCGAGLSASSRTIKGIVTTC